MSGWFSRGKEKSREPLPECKFCKTPISQHRPNGACACRKPRCDALSKKPYTDWTEDDWLYVKEKNIEGYRNFRRERDSVEAQRRQREFEQIQKEQEEQLEQERREHERRMKQEHENMLLKYNTQIHEMNMDTERKLSAVKKTLDISRRQHSRDMEDMEQEHEVKLQEKQKEIAKLKAAKQELATDFQRKYGEQQRELSERTSDMDSRQHQAWDDLDRKMKERSSALEAKLAESQAKFEKKLEKQRKVLEKEAEKAFTSRVTTELEVEKADRSRMKLSETTPGYVSQLANSLGLFSEPEDQSLFEDTS